MGIADGQLWEKITGRGPSWQRLYREEVGNLRPFYRVLDLSSVPDSVRQRWQARRIPMLAGQPRRSFSHGLLSRNVISSGAWTTFFAGTTVAAEVSALVILGPATAFGVVGGGAMAATLGGLAVAGGTGTGIAGFRYARDPKRLGKADRAAAKKAVWITPEALGRGPGRNRSTDEERLFHLTVRIAEGVVATNAWSSSLLDGHRVRLDLDESVAQIGRRLLEIHRLRADIADADSAATTQTLAGYSKNLNAAFASLATRVVTLHGYLQQLRALDVQLWQLAQVEKTNSLSDRVLDVLAATARDEQAGEQLIELGQETAMNAQSVESLLTDLADTVVALRLPEPNRPSSS